MSAAPVSAEGTLELVLTIESGGRVNVGGTDLGSIKPGKVRYDGLAKRTVDMLDAWLRRGMIQQRSELEVLGAHLFAILFDDTVVDAFQRQRDAARTQRRRLVVRLHFEDGNDKLAALPWEYLFSLGRQQRQGFFLSTHVDLILSRYLEAEARPRSELSGGPLRVLLVSSEPSDEPVEHFDFDAFTSAIARKAPKQIAAIEPFEDAGLLKVIERGSETDAHVLHLIAPGRDVDGVSEIAFKRDDDTPDWTDDTRFAEAFGTTDWRPSVIFLQLSQAAPEPADNGGRTDVGASFERVGPSLVRIAQIPAVVAMRSPVSFDVATEFCTWFYNHLAEGKPVDAAVQKGRSMVQLNQAPSWAFGTPVLYLHELEGLIQNPLVSTEPGRQEQRSTRSIVPAGTTPAAVGAEPDAEESGFSKPTVTEPVEATTGETGDQEVRALMDRAPRIIRAGRERLDALGVGAKARVDGTRWLMSLQRELSPLDHDHQNEYLIELKMPDDETKQEVLAAMVTAALDDVPGP